LASVAAGSSFNGVVTGFAEVCAVTSAEKSWLFSLGARVL